MKRLDKQVLTEAYKSLFYQQALKLIDADYFHDTKNMLQIKMLSAEVPFEDRQAARQAGLKQAAHHVAKRQNALILQNVTEVG